MSYSSHLKIQNFYVVYELDNNWVFTLCSRIEDVANSERPLLIIPKVQLRLRVTRRSWQKLFADKNFVENLVTAQTQLRSYSEQQRAFVNSNICTGGPVKLDSMWQHRLTRPLHVQHTYYRMIFKQNPFNIISRGVQRWTSTDFLLK